MRLHSSVGRALQRNADAMNSNPVEVPKFYFRVNLQLFKLQLPLRRSYLHLNLYFRSSHHLQLENSRCDAESRLIEVKVPILFYNYFGTKRD